MNASTAALRGGSDAGSITRYMGDIFSLPLVIGYVLKKMISVKPSHCVTCLSKQEMNERIFPGVSLRKSYLRS